MLILGLSYYLHVTNCIKEKCYSVTCFIAALPPEAFYETTHRPQQTPTSPPSLVHAARYLAPSQMMPPPPAGQYYISQPPPPAYGYPSPSLVPARPPFCLPAPLRQYIPPSPTPQMMTEPSPSMEVRSGTVYFNAETQQPELRVGGIFYGPTEQSQSTSAALPVRRPNSAIPIVNPQVLVHITSHSVEVQSIVINMCLSVPLLAYLKKP